MHPEHSASGLNTIRLIPRPLFLQSVITRPLKIRECRKADCELGPKKASMRLIASEGGHNGTSLYQMCGVACEAAARVRFAGTGRGNIVRFAAAWRSCFCSRHHEQCRA